MSGTNIFMITCRCAVVAPHCIGFAFRICKMCFRLCTPCDAVDGITQVVAAVCYHSHHFAVRMSLNLPLAWFIRWRATCNIHLCQSFWPTRFCLASGADVLDDLACASGSLLHALPCHSVFSSCEGMSKHPCTASCRSICMMQPSMLACCGIGQGDHV